MHSPDTPNRSSDGLGSRRWGYRGVWVAVADATPHTTQHNGTNCHVVGSGMDLVRNRDPRSKPRQWDQLQMGLEEGLVVGGVLVVGQS